MKHLEEKTLQELLDLLKEEQTNEKEHDAIEDELFCRVKILKNNKPIVRSER